jgi:hypothetical protein
VARREEERGWDAGWEAHEIAQRRRLSRLTLTEKLEWLEEAQRLVLHLGRKRTQTRPTDEPRS